MEFSILKDNDIWAERLRVIRDLYIEVEILSILEDNSRRCCMFILPPHILDRYMGSLVIPNGLKVGIIGERRDSGTFTHNLRMHTGSNTVIHGVISKEKQDGLDFIKAYNTGDNDKMGELLGYPKCCRNLYGDLHSQKLGIIDLVVPQYLEGNESGQEKTEVSIEGNPYANAMLRYIGVRLSPHMPCTPNCKDSVVLAKSVGLAMRKRDNKSFEHVLELLSMPMKYTAHNGIATITTPIVKIVVPNHNWGKEVVINYKPVLDITKQ